LIIGFHPLLLVEAFPTAYEATALCAAAELAWNGGRVLVFLAYAEDGALLPSGNSAQIWE
jgi:hypothetical protein